MESRSHEIESAVEGTCKWFFRHKTYASWVDCSRGLLWIKGKPGSGKSTLLKYALENYQPQDHILVLSFSSTAAGDELQRTPLGLFRSLLHQILSQDPNALPDLVQIFKKRCIEIGEPGVKWQWHERELRRIFHAALLLILEVRSIVLFVDALDECGERNAVSLAEDFKSTIDSATIQSADSNNFHICFACRHYPILSLDDIFEISLENENREDISILVKEQLDLFCSRTSSRDPRVDYRSCFGRLHVGASCDRAGSEA